MNIPVWNKLIFGHLDQIFDKVSFFLLGLEGGGIVSFHHDFIHECSWLYLSAKEYNYWNVYHRRLLQFVDPLLNQKRQTLQICHGLILKQEVTNFATGRSFIRVIFLILIMLFRYLRSFNIEFKLTLSSRWEHLIPGAALWIAIQPLHLCFRRCRFGPGDTDYEAVTLLCQHLRARLLLAMTVYLKSARVHHVAITDRIVLITQPIIFLLCESIAITSFLPLTRASCRAHLQHVYGFGRSWTLISCKHLGIEVHK